jgi:hypothetical protein
MRRTPPADHLDQYLQALSVLGELGGQFRLVTYVTPGYSVQSGNYPLHLRFIHPNRGLVQSAPCDIPTQCHYFFRHAVGRHQFDRAARRATKFTPKTHETPKSGRDLHADYERSVLIRSY